MKPINYVCLLLCMCNAFGAIAADRLITAYGAVADGRTNNQQNRSGKYVEERIHRQCKSADPLLKPDQGVPEAKG